MRRSSGRVDRVVVCLVKIEIPRGLGIEARMYCPWCL